MPHSSLRKFPDFDIDLLPALSVLSVHQPSIERARRQQGIYIEARLAGRLLFCGLDESAAFRTGQSAAAKVLGAYAEIRQSAIYPRLTSFIELELLCVAAGYKLNAEARHGSQQSIGGSFNFDSYREAVIHVAAWIWFARGWIGDSWLNACGDDNGQAKIETIDIRALSHTGSVWDAEGQQSSGERIHSQPSRTLLHRVADEGPPTGDDETDQ